MPAALLLLLALAASLPPAPRDGGRAGPAAAPADLAVAGVVVGRTPERSSAILTSGGRTRTVGGGRERLRRPAGVGERRTVPRSSSAASAWSCGCRPRRRPPCPAPGRRGRGPPVAPAGAPPEDPETPAREMSRVEVQRRLGEEIPRILAETAVAPVMEEGRVVGVQVTRLPEGSLLTDAGLRTGDVLTRINDTEIDGMATLIGLWPRLQSASELRAVVVRNGQPFSLLVSLR